MITDHALSGRVQFLCPYLGVFISISKSLGANYRTENVQLHQVAGASSGGGGALLRIRMLPTGRINNSSKRARSSPLRRQSRVQRQRKYNKAL